MNLLTKLSKKNLASGKLWRQIFGALVEWRPRAFWAFLLLLTPVSVGISYILAHGDWIPCVCLLGMNLAVWLVIKACGTLSGLFSLTKQEAGITWCQITILAALGLWIIGFILIFNIQKDGRLAAAFGVIGSVAGWIFQDKLKGVAAFIHLRRHHLLNIDDWIQVPKFNVDGEVKSVALTTVTILNWDTTTSVIPISALQADHFINLQN
ncbi:MAG: mechanosensitive ion channel, partial [Bacteroidales bacterium]|nr:mechanosensitive ion channel [Bacteroidales bacterium]